MTSKDELPGRSYEAFDSTLYRTHQRTLGFLKPESRVLEVGCANGALTEHIRALDCTVVGVERDPEAAEKARAFCEDVLVGDVETMSLNLEPESFDFLLLIDVLEHLVHPKAVLQRLFPFVRPTGLVVAAIPNIAHWSVRFRLLLGRFDYEDSGILDRTHLRFFTIHTAREMLEEAGLVTTESDIVPDVPLLRYKRRFARLNYTVAHILPNFFATEALFVGRPRRLVSSL